MIASKSVIKDCDEAEDNYHDFENKYERLENGYGNELR